MASVILPVVPNVARVIVKGTTQGSPFVNGFYVQYSGAGPLDLATLTTLALDTGSFYKSAFQTHLNTATSYVMCQAYDLGTRDTPIGVDTTSWSGTSSATTFPPVSVAMCISWQINARYRGGHPRFYLPSNNITDIAGGKNWALGIASTYQTAARSLRTSFNGMTIGTRTWTHVAVKYYSQHTLLGTPKVYPVLDAVVHSRIDSMRRRTGKETI